MDVVPQAFRLGRQSIKHSAVQAAEVDQEETFEVETEKEKPSSIQSSTTTDNLHCSAMSQTIAALSLDGMATTVTNQGIGPRRTGTEPPCYKGNKRRTRPFGFPTGLRLDGPREIHTVTL